MERFPIGLLRFDEISLWFDQFGFYQFVLGSAKFDHIKLVGKRLYFEVSLFDAGASEGKDFERFIALTRRFDKLGNRVRFPIALRTLDCVAFRQPLGKDESTLPSRQEKKKNPTEGEKEEALVTNRFCGSPLVSQRCGGKERNTISMTTYDSILDFHWTWRGPAERPLKFRRRQSISWPLTITRPPRVVHGFASVRLIRQIRRFDGVSWPRI